MTARRVVVLATVLAGATWTATSARTTARASSSAAFEEDSLRPGPDSGRVSKLLDALGATDRVVCDLVADQLGNSWWDDEHTGVGRFTDAASPADATKDSLAGRVRDPRAYPLLVSRMSADNPCARRIAAKLLGRSAVATDRLTALLDDASPRVREAAAYALGQSERREARGALERRLGGSGPEAAMSAWALGELGDSAAVPALIRAARSGDVRVRRAAVRALGSFEDERALPELERAARTDTDAMVRSGAVDALGEIGAASSAATLGLALNDATPEVRWNAAEALANLDDLDKAPEALVKAVSSNDPKLRRLAAHALAEIHDPATIDVLIGLMASADREIRLQAIEALSNIGSPKAVPSLVKALKDPDAEVRRAAAEALGEFKEG